MAKKKNIIPNKIFNCGFIRSSVAFIIPTPNIITGMLKIIITKLPIVKFFLFNKFIDPEIDVIQVIITDPIKKLKTIIFKLCISILSSKKDIGIIRKKGN